MAVALAYAKRAAGRGEVPVGAVVVLNGTVVGGAGNRKESLQDPTAHAEILAIRKAAKRLGGWRLPGASLYATLAPCPMCLGAMAEARISRLVFGCSEERQTSVVVGPLHRLSGVLDRECAGVLRDFFRDLRRKTGVLDVPLHPSGEAN
jgi:tRNA(adenine34) deaminase